MIVVLQIVPFFLGASSIWPFSDEHLDADILAIAQHFRLNPSVLLLTPLRFSLQK